MDAEEWGFNGNCHFEFEYDEFTTIEELIDEACRLSGASARDSLDSEEKTGFKIIVDENTLISFIDLKKPLIKVLETFEIDNEINSFIEITCGRGEVLHNTVRDKGFRFFIRSREGTRHHKPHVHVRHSNGNSGSVDLITGEQFKNGTLTKKQMRYVKSIVEKYNKELMEQWIYHTDGFRTDVNVMLGISKVNADLGQ